MFSLARFPAIDRLCELFSGSAMGVTEHGLSVRSSFSIPALDVLSAALFTLASAFRPHPPLFTLICPHSSPAELVVDIEL